MVVASILALVAAMNNITHGLVSEIEVLPWKWPPSFLIASKINAFIFIQIIEYIVMSINTQLYNVQLHIYIYIYI